MLRLDVQRKIIRTDKKAIARQNSQAQGNVVHARHGYEIQHLRGSQP